MKIKTFFCLVTAVLMLFTAAVCASEVQPAENQTTNEMQQPPEIPEGGRMPQGGRGAGMPPQMQNGDMMQNEQTNDTASDENAQINENPQPMRGGMGGNMWQQEALQADSAQSAVTYDYFTLISSGVLLAAGFAFIILYKRKIY